MATLNASLHLRLANIRRWLDKRLPDGGDFNDDNDYNTLLKMVKEWQLPIAIRVDSMNEYEAVLIEKLIDNNVNVYDKENTKEFYVLGCGWKTEDECRKWIQTRLEYFIPWTIGRYNAASKIY